MSVSNRHQAKRLYLTGEDRKLLEDTLRRALQLAQTEAMLTHPSHPSHDRLSHSQARLSALLARVRK